MAGTPPSNLGQKRPATISTDQHTNQPQRKTARAGRMEDQSQSSQSASRTMTTPTESTAEASPRYSFPNFSKLPAELRRRIFKSAASLPRVVVLEARSTKDQEGNTQQFMTSKTLAPAIMHATVESRAAGMEVYSPLAFQNFTGTYIDWSNDWVFFKGNSESAYMTYVRVLQEDGGDYLYLDVALRLERIAVCSTTLNKFVRGNSNRHKTLREVFPGKLHIYPKLETTALVEVEPGLDDKIENLMIVPKSTIPRSTPAFFCSQHPMTLTPERWLSLHDRYHQPVLLGHLLAGKGKLRSQMSKAVQAKLYERPKPPTAPLNLSNHSIVDLQRLAKSRQLECVEDKDVLTATIKVDEDLRYARAVAEYNEKLVRWAAMMLGHPSNSVYEQDEVVLSLRYEEIENFLVRNGLFQVSDNVR